MLSVNTNLTSTLMFTKHRLLYHIMLICNWLLGVIYYFIIIDSLRSSYIPTSRTTALHIYIAGSSPSSRRSSSGSSPSSHSLTTSPATLGTPCRALIAPRQAHRRALAARPRLWPRWGLLAELSSLLVRLVAELSLLDHVFGNIGDSSPSSQPSSLGSSLSSRSSTMSLATLGTHHRALAARHRALVACHWALADPR
jgi:hypothetical protein